MSEYIVEVNNSPTVTLDGWNVRCDDMFIQREPVVRCMDCRYCMGYWKANYCDYFKHSIEHLNGFCAWGERRKDE